MTGELAGFPQRPRPVQCGPFCRRPGHPGDAPHCTYCAVRMVPPLPVVGGGVWLHPRPLCVTTAALHAGHGLS